MYILRHPGSTRDAGRRDRFQGPRLRFHRRRSGLSLDTLLDRVEGYVRSPELKLLPSPMPDAPPLKGEASYMLQDVLLRGEMARGDVLRVSGMV